MAKSQDTFSKKEKEKQRQRKKQDKQLKKEERKANSQKGASLDDMMAYIDENGNISSTPPDRTKKKTFRAEDIQISIPKQGADEPYEVTRNGKVTFFNDSKGYGFIRDLETQESIFVHANGLVNEIRENDKVTFEVEMGQKGPNAVNVKLAN